MPNKRIPTEVRFWAKVDKSAGEDGCWIWTAKRNLGGYGHFWDGTYLASGRNRLAIASRWVYEHTNGPIPDNLLVCHRCDNPPCVNPSHLFLGTRDDNLRDMMNKGRDRHPCGPDHGMRLRPDRTPKGVRNGRAKLTEVEVLAIREAHEAGRSQRAVARDFGVRPETVGHIVRRKTWTHI